MTEIRCKGAEGKAWRCTREDKERRGVNLESLEPRVLARNGSGLGLEQLLGFTVLLVGGSGQQR